MNKMAIILKCLMEVVYCLCIACCLLTERKTKQSKTYASYRLVGLVTYKIITSPNSLITSKVKNILLKSVVTIILSLKRF